MKDKIREFNIKLASQICLDEDIIFKFDISISPEDANLNFKNKDTGEECHASLPNMFHRHMNGESIEGIIASIKSILLEDVSKYRMLEFNKVKVKIFPQLKHSDWGSPELYSVAFGKNTGLSIFFVLDMDDKMVFIQNRHIEEWGIDSTRVYEHAIDNLKSITGFPTHLQRGDKILYAYETRDSYDASKILTLDINSIQPQFKGRVCAIMPNRDCLLVFDEFSSKQFFTSTKKKLRADFSKTPYAVSCEVFVWNGDCWEIRE